MPSTDLFEDKNSGVSDKVESGDESHSEDKAICCKEGCKHEGGHEWKLSSNFYWLRCDIQSCKGWYDYHCAYIL